MSAVSVLNGPYALTDAQRAFFQNEGFIRLPNVLDGETIAHYLPAIRSETYERNPNKGKAISERDTYGKAFIQVTNLWERNETVREFAFSKRIAQIATELLGTRGVRMWHDQALFKEPSGGFTPWHVDQQYWPMDSHLCVTAWIPLQAVPIEMGPLCFGRGSHLKKIARDLEISDDSEKFIQDEVVRQKIVEVQEPYALGDVSFHYGWTLHRAGPNTSSTPREVFTVIFMDSAMRLASPKNRYQQADWEAFTPSTKIGDVMNDPKNPVLFEW